MKRTTLKTGLLVAILIIALSASCFPIAEAKNETVDIQIVDIHVFVGQTCPHCAQLEVYLDSLKEEYDYINPIYYEVWYDEDNRALFEQMAKDHGFDVKGVPTAFIGDEYFVGYSPQMNGKIIDAILSQLTNGNSTNSSHVSDYINVDPRTEEGHITNESEEYTGYEDNSSSKNSKVNKTSEETINLPILGEISSNSVSLPIITILLGFLDGFNPCAFFVLLFLLSMLVYARSKKRMLIIGLTFVFFSGLIYFLFMAAWLNFFMITKNITLITTIAGLVALTIAIINIKDFFAFKKGVSLSVSDEHRKSLISRMRPLLKAESMISMMIGAITLAVAANMYELLCTAGFPMVFTKLLVLHDLNTISYYSYLLFYNIVYIIPLLTIVLLFTYTFGAKKLSQSQGEALKLLSGMMMLALGGVLVFKPGLLNNIFVAIGAIASALIATGIILLIRKKLRTAKKKEGEKKEEQEEKKEMQNNIS
jgi:glutaredoxin